ncbi:hypothetical protein EPI10_029438 [Gossypium australe]|uniref:Uncharacterized protein n=1 Tax=Gossypium australe TaxID=47621 RepID=A0A5B6V1I2_9ROSI|nr:hypothetical protein EPI10_029438 [Gossypium australe]
MEGAVGRRGLSGASIRMDKSQVPEVHVSELFNVDREDWNEVRVTEIYDHADQRVWFHNPCGFFSTKSAYSWQILRQIGFCLHRFFWRLVWKLNTLPKIQ